MVSRQFVVLAFILVTLAPAASAFGQDRQAFERPTMSATMPGAGPLSSAIERIRFDSVGDHPAVRTARASSSAAQATQRGSIWGRVVFASLAGMAGFVGGGIVGAKIEGPCSCDDPGFKGAVIGAPIGAVVGAVAGWKVAGLLIR